MLFGKAESKNQTVELYSLDGNGNFQKNEPIYTYWWDGVPNFGDWIGPYLLSKISNRPLINVRGQKRTQALFSVGSILEHINENYQQAEVWGSGLIQVPHRKRIKKLKKYISQVHAVRGEYTYQQLTQNVGLNVPKVFGDPALLMPRFYQPQNLVQDKICICPHFSHYQYFSEIEGSDQFNIIDVRNSVQNVVDQIVSSKVCISSSLHGLIIAQAYGVPWVWLDLNQKSLDDFKFEDFFSTLKNKENIYRKKFLVEQINERSLLSLSQYAGLFEQKYSNQTLLDAYPY